jgi:uncharacterized protein Yka (UPF0111/DUF47 family)
MSFFRRNKTNFYELLFEQAKKVEEGMKALLTYMKEPRLLNGRAVLRLEEDADDIRERVVQELNKTFVTPIDREDIYALSRAIDDIIDYGKSTVEELMAFEMPPNKHMLLMSEGLCEAASAIADAVSHLEDSPDKAQERIIFAKKRENYVEHCYREALVELFKGDNVVSILKNREVYRHLSNAADRGDEAANILGNILVKMV